MREKKNMIATYIPEENVEKYYMILRNIYIFEFDISFCLFVGLDNKGIYLKLQDCFCCCCFNVDWEFIWIQLCNFMRIG